MTTKMQALELFYPVQALNAQLEYNRKQRTSADEFNEEPVDSEAEYYRRLNRRHCSLLLAKIKHHKTHDESIVDMIAAVRASLLREPGAGEVFERQREVEKLLKAKEALGEASESAEAAPSRILEQDKHVGQASESLSSLELPEFLVFSDSQNPSEQLSMCISNADQEEGIESVRSCDHPLYGEWYATEKLRTRGHSPLLLRALGGTETRSARTRSSLSTMQLPDGDDEAEDQSWLSSTQDLESVFVALQF